MRKLPTETPEVLVQHVVVPEHAEVLRQHVERAARRAHRPPVQAVRVRRAQDVRLRLVDFRVDRVGGWEEDKISIVSPLT